MRRKAKKKKKKNYYFSKVRDNKDIVSTLEEQ